MDVKDKISYWLENAKYDLDTAYSMHKNARYAYTSFMCQQAIEKVLKAIHLKILSKEAPRTHNLIYLITLLDIKLKEEESDLLTELTSYYLEGRYPDYKQHIEQIVTREKSKEILSKSRRLFLCLKKLTKK